jgi:hypothetical protein
MAYLLCEQPILLVARSAERQYPPRPPHHHWIFLLRRYSNAHVRHLSLWFGMRIGCNSPFDIFLLRYPREEPDLNGSRLRMTNTHSAVLIKMNLPFLDHSSLVGTHAIEGISMCGLLAKPTSHIRIVQPLASVRSRNILQIRRSSRHTLPCVRHHLGYSTACIR